MEISGQCLADSSVFGNDTNHNFFGERSSPKPASQRRVLLLQGPVGPFMPALQSKLLEQGVDAWAITFNAADRLETDHSNRIDFYGGVEDWRSWFMEYIQGAKLDIIIMFGSERPAHKIARFIAHLNNVPVLSLEEGYIRPGFITAEWGGNNASSPFVGCLPDTDWDMADEEHVSIQRDFKSFNRMGARAAYYYAVRTLFTHGASEELFHRHFDAASEVFYWGRNLYRRIVGQGRNFSIIQRLLEHFDKSYYLIPLQVAADSNLAEAALGWNTNKLIAHSLRSFADSAPKGTRLVFKIHPLERGHSEHSKLIMSTADSLGIGDRVDVIESGSLGLLTRHAAGMITINSTSGLSAIYHGVPLMVVGKAVYSCPELATCAEGDPDFAQFWTSKHVASARLRRRYLNWLKSVALVPGDFYVDDGIQVAVNSVWTKLKERLLEPSVEPETLSDMSLATERKVTDISDFMGINSVPGPVKARLKKKSWRRRLRKKDVA